MVIENLINLLAPLCPEILEQGSMAQDEQYPTRFFTFWNPSTEDHKHYDNTPHGYRWDVDVNFYSTDPEDVYSTLEAARKTLLAAGWIIGGKGHAVASDHPTHTGRGFSATYIEF